jgi:ribosomal-protein-alanine N-acetyltransferase
VYANRNDPASVDVIRDLITGKIDKGISANEAISWAISKKGEPEFLGTISFHKTDRQHHRAEIGYQLHFDYWRKGFMTEAINAVIKYGFTEMKLHSIEAKVNINNIASIKFLEKSGFVKEGHFTEDYFYNGEYLDTGVYSLVNRK